MVLKRTKLMFILIFLVGKGEMEVLQNNFGWCRTEGKVTSDGGYVMYDTKTQVCAECRGNYFVQPREEMKEIRCCPDGTMKKMCTGEDGACGDGGHFSASQRCDEQNDCANGKDEENCTSGCSKFSCGNTTSGNYTSNRCIDISMVCDGKKDCVSGRDESSCIYTGGRCDGGFLCTRFAQCVGLALVCNRAKDCLDGSDETMCHDFMRAKHFECWNSAGYIDGFTLDEICDGGADCDDDQDEANCYMWSQWSPWSECQCLTSDHGIETLDRERSCGTLLPAVKSEGKCAGSAKETRPVTCPCSEKSGPSTTTYAIIALTVVLILVVGLVILSMARRRKRAWLSYRRAAISFPNNTTTESLIGQSASEATHNQSETQPQHYSDRRLPATPPIPTVFQDYSTTSFSFSRQKSFSSNNVHEDRQTSILVPREDDTVATQHFSMANPLYHAYNESRGHIKGRDHLSLPDLMAAHELSESEKSLKLRSATCVSKVEDDSDCDDDLDVMEQIAIAHMGNLIEVSNIKIN